MKEIDESIVRISLGPIDIHFLSIDDYVVMIGRKNQQSTTMMKRAKSTKATSRRRWCHGAALVLLGLPIKVDCFAPPQTLLFFAKQELPLHHGHCVLSRLYALHGKSIKSLDNSSKPAPPLRNAERRGKQTPPRQRRGGLSSAKSAPPPPRPDLRTQLEFSRNGHCVMRQLYPEQRIVQLKRDLMAYAREQELLAWKQKVDVAAQSPEQAQACRTVADCQRALAALGVPPGEVPFLQYFNTWRELPLVLETARELAATAAVLLDCDSVRLYQDSLFWKRAGDGPTPWHTDGRMAPFDTSLLLTIWIPLQDIPPSGSALVFCSKSHSDFALPYWNEYSKTHQDDDSPWNHLDERYGGESAMVDYMPMAMGDITAHSGWVLHCADPAPPGALDRVALAISFVDARAPVRQRATSSRWEKKQYGGNQYDDVGDPEDAWSYRDWIHQVPKNQPNIRHELIPILYPRQQQTKQKSTRSSNKRK